MKCEYCKVKDVDDKRKGAIKKALVKKYCSDVCVGRAKLKRRQAKKKPVEVRICQMVDCEKPITSPMKQAKACSRECGQQLRKVNTNKRYKLFGDSDLSSNSLIRLKNKFLQMPLS